MPLFQRLYTTKSYLNGSPAGSTARTLSVLMITEDSSTKGVAFGLVRNSRQRSGPVGVFDIPFKRDLNLA